MISLKSLLFIGLFGLCTVGALFLPHIGIYGYIADYCIGPAKQWWEAPFSGLGIRYSLTLALATIVGFILQIGKARFGASILKPQEVLILFFLCAIWFSYLTTGGTVSRYSTIDHPAVKFTKIVVFLLLITHIITDKRKLTGLMWAFIASATVLGLQAWSLPRRAFVSGRLEGIGGADFSESNFFAAFMAAMLPIIGIQLLRSKKLWQKAVCVVAAAFTANTIVLCRSRGAFVGIFMGCFAALLMAPRKYRKKIIIGLVLGMIGGIYVMDEQFMNRMTTIIVAEEEERDESASSRFRLWQAGLEMVSDKPLGIGIGNWYQTIGNYIPEYSGKDSHNTFVKCIAELGIQGFLLFSVIIFIAITETFRIRAFSQKLSPDDQNDFSIMAFGLCLSIVIILTCGLTITMIYTEIIWIILMLPVCLRRALENEYFMNQTKELNQG